MSLVDDIAELLGGAVAHVAPVTRGHHTLHRVRVTMADGRRAFVKADHRSSRAVVLEAEHATSCALPPGFGPRVVAFGFSTSSGRTLLALELLDDVRWLPPWEPRDLDAVIELLGRVGAVPAPAPCLPLRRHRPWLEGWGTVAANVERFLALDLRSSSWLARSLPVLQDLEVAADLDGDSLVHFDVRSDNLYLADGRAGLVDWGWAAQGPAGFDLTALLPSVHQEGGPAPWDVYPGADTALIALLAGYWASQAGLPEPAETWGLRRLQRSQLASTLLWLEHRDVVGGT